MKLLRKLLKIVLAALLLCWLGGLALFRYVNPPLTPTMLISSIERGQWVRHRSLPLARISPALMRAVIVSEDARFCLHRGIDIGAVQDAMADYQENGRLRGASTISMQVARNVFLWTGGGVVRKLLEAPLALALDAFWPKRRTLEIYLNIAEWGPGVFGAEAAAQTYFHKPAAALSGAEAARLAAILPSPLHWSPTRLTPFMRQRAAVIEKRSAQLNRAQLACLK
jgi:monofunctional biosynthetic peptidoglycan transglycosylase